MTPFLVLSAGLVSLLAYTALAAQHKGRPGRFRCYLLLAGAALIHLVALLLQGR